MGIYDNDIFSALTEADGLPSNFIWSLYEDSKGNIWIGSLNGLSKYNPITKTFNGNFEVLMEEVLVPNTSYNR